MPHWYSSDPPEQKLEVFSASSSWKIARAAAALITVCNSCLPSAGEQLLCVSVFYPQGSYPGKLHGIRSPALHSSCDRASGASQIWGFNGYTGITE